MSSTGSLTGSRIDRVRVRAPAGTTPADLASSLRQGLTQWLNQAEAACQTLSPDAIVVVRQVRAPRQTLRHGGPALGYARPESPAATASLRTALHGAQHGLPGLGTTVGAGCPAVWFDNEAEVLAGLALDALGGTLAHRWWWRRLLGQQVHDDLVQRHWVSAPKHVPQALALMQTAEQGAQGTAWLRHMRGSSREALLQALALVFPCDAGVLAWVRGGEQGHLGPTPPHAQHPLASTTSDGDAAVRLSRLCTALSQRPQDAADARAFLARHTSPTDRMHDTAAGAYAPHAHAGASRPAPARATTADPAARVPTPSAWPQARADKPKGATPQREQDARPSLGHPVTAHQKAPPAAQQTRPLSTAPGDPTHAIPSPAQPSSGPREAQASAPGSEAGASPSTGHGEPSRPSPSLRLPPDAQPEPMPAHAAQALAHGPANAHVHRPTPLALGPHTPAPPMAAANATGPRDVPPASPRIGTSHAGLFFLLNAAVGLGWYGDFTQPQHRCLDLSPWQFLRAAGQALAGPTWPQDPLAEWLLAMDATPLPRTGVRPLWAPLRARLALALGLPRLQATRLTLSLPGQVHLRPGRVDVHIPLGQLPLAVRMAGLDRDIGWLPAAGLDIRFHFDVGSP